MATRLERMGYKRDENRNHV